MHVLSEHELLSAQIETVLLYLAAILAHQHRSVRTNSTQEGCYVCSWNRPKENGESTIAERGLCRPRS